MDLITDTKLVSDKSQVSRMVPGTKWAFNKYLWNSSSHL